MFCAWQAGCRCQVCIFMIEENHVFHTRIHVAFLFLRLIYHHLKPSSREIPVALKSLLKLLENNSRPKITFPAELWNIFLYNYKNKQTYSFHWFSGSKLSYKKGNSNVNITLCFI